MNMNEKRLIETILNYSCNVSSVDKVIIELLGKEGYDFAKELKVEIEKIGATAYICFRDEDKEAVWLERASVEDIKKLCEKDLKRAVDSTVYIMIKAPSSDSPLGSISANQQKLYQQYYYQPMYEHVLNKMRWLSMRYPSSGLAKNAGMTLSAFEEKYYALCQTNYAELSLAMDKLVDLMSKSKKVKITGPGTDLTFNIDHVPVHKCDGKINLPDGEVYTAPIKNSVNGHISFNTRSNYQGTAHDNVKLTFKDGKVIHAFSSNQEAFDTLLQTDEGASYIGEFALGVNPEIKEALGDILFDEKIKGSFHLALGSCYENASNGNKSAIHWDLVCIQTATYGGGEIYFDDVLIRKNGIFLTRDLQALNG